MRDSISLCQFPTILYIQFQSPAISNFFRFFVFFVEKKNPNDEFYFYSRNRCVLACFQDAVVQPACAGAGTCLQMMKDMLVGFTCFSPSGSNTHIRLVWVDGQRQYKLTAECVGLRPHHVVRGCSHTHSYLHTYISHTHQFIPCTVKTAQRKWASTKAMIFFSIPICNFVPCWCCRPPRVSLSSHRCP